MGQAEGKTFYHLHLAGYASKCECYLVKAPDVGANYIF